MNKKGTTWKAVDEAVKESIVSANEALPLLQEKNQHHKKARY